MEKKDYLKAIKIPFILLIIATILSYILYFITYKDVTTLEQAISSADAYSVFATLLMIFSYAIVFYAGWIAVSKFNGTIKNSLFMGLIVGGIHIVLSMISSVLMYTMMPGYRLLFSPELGEFAIFIILGGMLITIPFVLAIDMGVAALGGFISKKANKK